MRTLELNAEGNFDVWDSKKLDELKKNASQTKLGHFLLFENDRIGLGNHLNAHGTPVFQKTSKSICMGM